MYSEFMYTSPLKQIEQLIFDIGFNDFTRNFVVKKDFFALNSFILFRCVQASLYEALNLGPLVGWSDGNQKKKSRQ